MGLTLRVRLLEHLDTLSADYYEDTPVGAAMYPLKEPIDEISYFGSDLLPAILRMLLTTAFTLAAMSALSPVLTHDCSSPDSCFPGDKAVLPKKACDRCGCRAG